jgi:hypothetical protein
MVQQLVNNNLTVLLTQHMTQAVLICLPGCLLQCLSSNFSLSGMSVAAEGSIDVTFTLTKDAACPTNTNAALQPVVNILRRNCDGSVRRGAAAVKSIESKVVQCSGAGVFKAPVTAPFMRGDACFGIRIVLADGVSKMAIVKYA